MKKINEKILSNKGVTGIDLVISIIVLSIFAGLIASLLTIVYKNSIEIQKSANAMSYATIVIEKIDEKAFEEIDGNFVADLINNGEITIDTDYTVNLSTGNLNDKMKKAVVEVKFDVNGEQKSIIINKLKIKEIYKEWERNI